MAETTLNHSMVRILINGNREKEPVGGGLLISPNHILTCAHVVLNALGLSFDTQVLPSETIYIDFPLIEKHPQIKGRVVTWFPVKHPAMIGDLEDIAVLELTDGRLPEKAAPAEWVVENRENYMDRGIMLCGFPRGMSQGIWTHGQLKGLTGNGWVQFDPDPGEKSITPEFSGSAVWDKNEHVVVGIAVSTASGEKHTSAFMIPGSVLDESMPDDR